MKDKIKKLLSIALCFTTIAGMSNISEIQALAASDTLNGGSFSITDPDYPDLENATVSLTADGELTLGNFLSLNITGENGEDLTYHFISKLKDADTGEDLSGYRIMCTEHNEYLKGKPFLISSSLAGKTVYCEVFNIDRNGQEVIKESNRITIPEFGDNSYSIEVSSYEPNIYETNTIASLLKNGESIEGYGAEWFCIYKSGDVIQSSNFNKDDNEIKAQYSISNDVLFTNNSADTYIKIYTTSDKSEYIVSDVFSGASFEVSELEFTDKIMVGTTPKVQVNSYENLFHRNWPAFHSGLIGIYYYYYINNEFVGYYDASNTENSFKIPENSEGKEFKVIELSRNRLDEYVTNYQYNFISEAGTASATAIIEAYQEPITPSLKIEGKPTPGNILKPVFNTEYIEANGLNEDDFEYLWVINDGQKMVSKKTYEIQPEDIGSYILLSVSIKDPDGNYTDSAESDMIRILDKTVTISGSTNVDDVITATVEGEFTTDEEKGFVYTWYVEDGVEIEGAGNTKEMLITEEIMKQIEGKNIYCSLNDGNEESFEYISNKISVPTSSIENNNLIITNKNTGKTPVSVTQRDTLIANITGENIPEDVYYMWFVEGESKAGFAIGETITITDELIKENNLNGKRIYCIAESPTNESFKLESELIEVVNTGSSELEINSGKCNVFVSQGQSFSVTIPAFISMNGEKNSTNETDFYTVVIADIAGGDSIKVEPVKLNVTLSQAGKRDLEAIISTTDGWEYEINKNGVSEDDLSGGITRNHKITVAKLSAGRWRGTFNWNVTTIGTKIKDSEEYVEYRQFNSVTKEWTDLGRQ